MKAFMAKYEYNIKLGEHDYLILAKTKKDAKVAFNQLKNGYNGFGYLNKNFLEVEIEELDVYSMDIYAHNQERANKDNSVYTYCFKPEFRVMLTKEDHFYYKEEIIAETEDTYKEFVKLFKQQNQELLKKYF